MTDILVIEDDSSIADGLCDTLKTEGYSVELAGTGSEARAIVERDEPRTIVLDLGLPDCDGLNLLAQWRDEGRSFPVLVLSARTLELDKVRALDRGADDYLTKPFGLAELLARLRALLRRGGVRRAGDERLTFGMMTIDFARHEARRGDRPIALTAREYRLLEYLALNRGIVLSRERILEAVWGRDCASGLRTVDVHVAKLRRKVERNCDQPEHIVTVRSAGYRFVE